MSTSHDNYFSQSQDTYLDQETGVLRNIPQLQTTQELEQFEEIIFQAYFAEASEYIEGQSTIGMEQWRYGAVEVYS